MNDDKPKFIKTHVPCTNCGSSDARSINEDGSLRWTFVNRSDKGQLYELGWSRILHKDEDIQIIKNFLSSQGKCNE